MDTDLSDIRPAGYSEKPSLAWPDTAYPGYLTFLVPVKKHVLVQVDKDFLANVVNEADFLISSIHIRYPLI